MKPYTAIFILFLLSFKAQGQISYYSDVFHGGVTGDGYNPWYQGDPSTINISIEPGSTVRKAFLFYNLIQPKNISFEEKEEEIYLNSIPITITTENIITKYVYDIASGNERIIRMYSNDITDLIDPSINLYTLFPPDPSNPTEEVFFAEFYLLVLYENPSLNKTAINIYLNDKNASPNIDYLINSSSVIDTTKNVGLSIHSSNICDTSIDGSFIYVNTSQLGLIGGQEENTAIDCAGVTGTFYYQNYLLFGIGNDIADNTMVGLDAIATIESYLTNQANFDLKFEYQSNFGPKTNTINQLFLTYSTPCDTFSFSVPNDTTICSGETLQLNVSGGQTYEWLPATDLSCSDCPDPVFSGDTSRFYTVRIWNNDSCSVVRPVKINVRPKPEFASISSQPSECGTNNGSVSLNSAAGTQTPVTFSLNDTLNQSSGNFTNLASGIYTFNLTDGFGCVSEDTLITIGEVINTNASFTVTPATGTVPLTVSINNTSQNATDYLWSVNGLSEGNSLSSYTCAVSGSYEIELIAWKYDPSCADTFTISIIAIDRLIIPTAFTPDKDGVNDYWEIPNLDAIYPENIVRMYNRWGLMLFESEKGKYADQPWDGTFESKELPVASYYFIIETNTEVGELKGNVSIIK